MKGDFETLQSINLTTLIPTFVCFGFGLFYYFYKFRNLRTSSENTRGPRGGNLDLLGENPENNLNQNFDDNITEIRIFVMIHSEKKSFRISRSTRINDFVKNDLKRNLPNFNENQTLYLICQGRRLEESKRFSDYPIIGIDTVIHCFITNSGNGAQRNLNIISNDENAVSIYTLLIHTIILLFIVTIIYCYKISKEIFNKVTLICLQFMIFVWAIQVSKCIAKLIVHKKIVFN